MDRRRLGVFYTETPAKESPLSKFLDRNLLMFGTLSTIRKHVARILLDLDKENRSYANMDAYRLVEIFLEKDQEYETSAPTTDYDLFIILLGFADPPNRMLPNLVTQVINRRELIQKPTWVVLGCDPAVIGTKYNLELATKLETFRKVPVKQ